MRLIRVSKAAIAATLLSFLTHLWPLQFRAGRRIDCTTVNNVPRRVFLNTSNSGHYASDVAKRLDRNLASSSISPLGVAARCDTSKAVLKLPVPSPKAAKHDAAGARENSVVCKQVRDAAWNGVCRSDGPSDSERGKFCRVGQIYREELSTACL